MKIKVWLQFAVALAVFPGAVLVRGDETDGITAVFGSVHNGYARVRLAEGKFQTETYAFGEGGLANETMNDRSIDGLPFMTIARTIAPALARQGYVPSSIPEKTDLLIMVYWGMTGADTSVSAGYNAGVAAITPPPPLAVIGGGRGGVAPPPPSTGPSEQSRQDNAAFDMAASMQNRKRDRANFTNAQILGYFDELNKTDDNPRSVRHRDLIEEIEDPRYYVVLMAYDFRTMWKEKTKKLLWVTRFSIRVRHNLFDESLGSMALMASKYFGQESRGLLHENPRTGRVDLGEMKVLEMDPKK